jgi:photosynthetic reaction center H subunit
MSPVIVGNIDVAMLCLWAFVLFFIGLVVYLNRESRREGYPLEDEVTGLVGTPKLVDIGATKTFLLPHGQGTVTSPPSQPRDPVEIKAKKAWRGRGSPYVPSGNPLLDGVGPAAYANRAKHADLDWEGRPRIVPLRAAAELSVARGDPDPRGYAVYGVDLVKAGDVTELWVDRADRLLRYLEVSLANGRRVLVPMTMSVVKARQRAVVVDAITAAQFADAPGIEHADTVTLYEEDRIVGYFGGGYLYATPERAEPLI